MSALTELHIRHCLMIFGYRALALGLVIALHGCLGVVVPVAGDPDPFTEGTLVFIETGKTTKEEIRLTMSQPPFSLGPAAFQDGKLWIYRIDRQITGYAGCVAVYYGGAGCDYERRHETAALVLKFDEQDVVTYWWEGVDTSMPVSTQVAITEFDLELRGTSKDFELVTKDGLDVEAVIPVDWGNGYEVGFRGKTELLLVIEKKTDGTWREIYFGEANFAREAADYSKDSRNYLTNIGTLEELNARLP